jgi:hypothetical protein
MAPLPRRASWLSFATRERCPTISSPRRAEHPGRPLPAGHPRAGSGRLRRPAGRVLPGPLGCEDFLYRFEGMQLVQWDMALPCVLTKGAIRGSRSSSLTPGPRVVRHSTGAITSRPAGGARSLHVLICAPLKRAQSPAGGLPWPLKSPVKTPRKCRSQFRLSGPTQQACSGSPTRLQTLGRSGQSNCQPRFA